MELEVLLASILLFLLSISIRADALECYHCEEDFEHVWNPYTNCQINANLTASKQCLPEEIYCMVKKVSFKSMTISIKRECTDTCYYGCRAKDFGITKVTCVSCCQDNLCNVGGTGSRIYPNLYLTIGYLFFIV